MLDFENPNEREKAEQTLRVRHGQRFADLLDRASTFLGVDRSVFVRASVEQEAKRVLADQSHHALSPDDVDAFQRALDERPSPTPKAKMAAEFYRAHVVHAD